MCHTPCAARGGFPLPSNRRANGILLAEEERDGVPGWRTYLVGDPRYLNVSQDGSSSRVTTSLLQSGKSETWVRSAALLRPCRYDSQAAPVEGGARREYLDLTEDEVGRLATKRKLMENADARARMAKAWADAQPSAGEEEDILALAATLRGAPMPQGTGGDGDVTFVKEKRAEEGESTLTGGTQLVSPSPQPLRSQGEGGASVLRNALTVGESLSDAARLRQLQAGDPLPPGAVSVRVVEEDWREYREMLRELITSYFEGNTGWQVTGSMADCASLLRERYSHEATMALVMGITALIGCRYKFPNSKWKDSHEVFIDLTECEPARAAFVRGMRSMVKTEPSVLLKEASRAGDASLQLLYARKVTEMSAVMLKACHIVETSRLKELPRPVDKTAAGKRKSGYAQDPWDPMQDPLGDRSDNEPEDGLAQFAVKARKGGKNATAKGGRGARGRGRGGRGAEGTTKVPTPHASPSRVPILRLGRVSDTRRETHW